MVIDYLRRVYTVVEIRTGFVASSSMLLGSALGIYLTGSIQTIATILLCISAFMLNLVANIAAEISGYLKREDSTEYLTGHLGSEGLARNEASLKDAISILIICIAIAGITGILAVMITQKIILLAIGIVGFLVALLYSLTPIAIAKFPISELVSGILCGFLCTFAGAIIYEVDMISIILLSSMTLLMVSFLMAANNTVDYEKDLKTRVTFPHLIGFRRSITIIIPQLILLFALWVVFSIYNNALIIGIIGSIVLLYFGLYKWYIPYYKVKEYRDGLGRKYGPLPLVLLLNFNFIMSGIFIIGGVL